MPTECSRISKYISEATLEELGKWCQQNIDGSLPAVVQRRVRILHLEGIHITHIASRLDRSIGDLCDEALPRKHFPMTHELKDILLSLKSRAVKTSNTYPLDLVEDIRKLEKAGYSRRLLCEQSGISYMTIYKWTRKTEVKEKQHQLTYPMPDKPTLHPDDEGDIIITTPEGFKVSFKEPEKASLFLKHVATWSGI